jgi:hypothetical protein
MGHLYQRLDRKVYGGARLESTTDNGGVRLLYKCLLRVLTRMHCHTTAVSAKLKLEGLKV